MAMVPLADLFNHKAAVVQLGGAYTVEDICFEDMSESDQEENGAEAADVQSDQSNDSDQSSDAPAGVLQLNGGLADIQVL